MHIELFPQYEYPAIYFQPGKNSIIIKLYFLSSPTPAAMRIAAHHRLQPAGARVVARRHSSWRRVQRPVRSRPAERPAERQHSRTAAVVGPLAAAEHVRARLLHSVAARIPRLGAYNTCHPTPQNHKPQP